MPSFFRDDSKLGRQPLSHEDKHPLQIVSQIYFWTNLHLNCIQSKLAAEKLPSFCTIKPHVILCLLGWVLPNIGKWTLKANCSVSAQFQRMLLPPTIFVSVHHWLHEISEISVRCCNDRAKKRWNANSSAIHDPFLCFSCVQTHKERRQMKRML